MADRRVRTLFATRLFEGRLDDAALLAALEHSCRTLAEDDRAGRAWCRTHHYAGYTSYASLDDLPQRDPAFAALKRWLDIEVRAFAEAAFLDFEGRRPKLIDLWVNVLKPGGSHSGHIHPHAAVSGTFYVAVPPGSSALKLEDPRLPMMMHAPRRAAAAPEDAQTFVYVQPEAGTLLLWESWLRHEVPANRARSERISVSFNFG